MKIFNYNARGLGLPEKRRFIREQLNTDHVDILCIQETKKDSFSPQFLRSLSGKFDS
jgi:exonuclease III